MLPLKEGLARLTALSSGELRQAWVDLTALPIPQVSPAMLRLALSYELQVRALGGLSRTSRSRLDQIASAKPVTTCARGTRLAREWNGTMHVVTVSESGTIRWNDRDWRSLSEVARAITGTRWSGPAFFGLKRKLAA